MKTILVPVDFSEVALNAIDYACEMAKLTKAKLIFFHVYYTPPVVAADAPLLIPSLDELEADCMLNLEAMKKKTQLKHGNQIEIECACKWGFPTNEINAFAQKSEVDLIIMGMNHGGYLSEKLIGSNTTSVLRKAECPLLVIDEKAKFKSIGKIVFACDFEGVENEKYFKPLLEIANLFKSHIYILHVVPDAKPIPSLKEDWPYFTHFKNSFTNSNYSIHYLKKENVVKGINEFVSEKNSDMVVMIPHSHSFVDTILHEPNTKRMAFHTKVPLLTLH